MEHTPPFSLPAEVLRNVQLTTRALRSFKDSEFIVPELRLPSTYLLKKPGKLLRPALVFLGAQYSGLGSTERFVDLAMAIELLHISSLINDDMIDQDLMRRGVKSVHLKFGRERAIIAANALIAKSIEKSSGYGPAAITATSNAAMEMCAGEALDYKYQKLRSVPSVRECIRIAELKSASLISAAASVSSHSAGLPTSGELASFGRLFGIGFQIRDDVFDFLESGSQKKNASRELEAFRPNIVRSIMQSQQDPARALQIAVNLNNKYLAMALSQLKVEEGAGSFSEYAKLVQLDYKELPQ